MPKYRITAPDGSSYDVTAPEGTSQEQALEFFKTNYKPSTVTATTAAAATPPPPQPQPEGEGLETALDQATEERRAERLFELARERKFSERNEAFVDVQEGLTTGLRRMSPVSETGKIHPWGPLAPVSAVIETAGDIAKLTKADKAVHVATQYGADLAEAIVTDIGSGKLTSGAPATFAALSGDPITYATPEGTGPKLAVESIRTVGGMAPAMAGVRAGVPPSVAFGTHMGLNALAETGDPEYAARQAVAGALLGKAGEAGTAIGEAAGLRIASKLPPALENATVAAARLTGQQVGMNLPLLAGQAPELVQQWQQDPTKAAESIAHQFAIGFAISLPHVPAHLRFALSRDMADGIVKSPEYKEWLDNEVRQLGVPEAARGRLPDVDPAVDAMRVASARADANNAPATAAALKQQETATTAAATASVPFMITAKMEAELLARGMTQEAINKLTPQEANNILGTASEKVAPVVYLGYQKPDAKYGSPGFHLYNLTEAISERQVKGSTVTAESLEKAGYKIPESERSKAFDAEERFAIDEAAKINEAQGLPADVILSDEIPAENQPFAPRFAYVDQAGNIVINRSLLREKMEGVKPEDRAAALQALLAHEGIHSVARNALTDAEISGLWNSLTAGEKAIARKAYTGTTEGLKADGTPYSDAQMGHEYLRRAMERAMGGGVFELSKASEFGRFSAKTLDIIERVIAAVRRLVGSKASTQLDEMLGRMQENIDAAKAEGKRAEPEAAKPKKNPIAQAMEDMTSGKTKFPNELESKDIDDITYADSLVADWSRVSPEIRAEYNKAIERLNTNPNERDESFTDMVESQIYVRKRAEPEARRPKRKEQVLPLTPAEKGVERPSAEEAGALPERTITPKELDAAMDRHMAESAAPNFRAFADELKETYPKIKEGQLRDAWEDAVWRRAQAEIAQKQRKIDRRYSPSPRETLNKQAEELDRQATDIESAKPKSAEELRQRGLLGLEQAETNARKEAADAFRRQAEQLRKQAMEASAEPMPETAAEQARSERAAEADYRPGEVRPEHRIATEALKLIRQAREGRAPLHRRTVTPDEVRTNDPKGWRDIEPRELFRPDFASSLTEGSAADRTTSTREIVSEGVAATIKRKAPKASETKRLTALLDNETGRVELVSTYADKGERRIVDPRKTHLPERPNVPIESLLNEGRYTPIASALLDEPVKNFHQRFKDRGTFESEFAAKARGEHEAQNIVAEGVAKEGERAEPIFRTSNPMTDTEAGGILDFAYDEVDRITERADFDNLIPALSDRLSATPRTRQTADERTRARLVAVALEKAVRATEQANPELAGTDAAITKTLDTLYENAAQAPTREAFVKAILEQFSPQGTEPVSERGTEGTGQGADYRALAEARREHERRLAARSESERLEAALRSREPINPLSPEPSELRAEPEAFLGRPGRRPVEKIGDALGRVVGAPLRLTSEWMTDRLRRVALTLPRYERGIVEDITGKFNQIISDQRGYSGDMNARFGDAIKQITGALREPGTLNPSKAIPWLNDVERMRVTKRAGIRNFVEAVEGRLPPSTPEQARVVGEAQQANLLIGQTIEPVAPGFAATGNVQRNLTGYGMDIIRHGPGTEDWNILVAGTAEANTMTRYQAERNFRRMRAELNSPGADAATVGKVAQDFTRYFPRAITDIWHGGPGVLGHWEPVIHAKPYEYFHNAIERAAAVRAFREVYPRDTQYVPNPMGGAPIAVNALNRDYAALRRALPAKWHGLVDSMFRVLQGQPTENAMAGTADQLLGSAFSKAGVLRGVASTVTAPLKAMQLSLQLAMQPAELLSGGSHIFFGARESFKQSLARFSKDYQAMEGQGIVDRMMYNDAYDPTAPVKSTARILGNFVRRVAGENVFNEMQEARDGAVALVKARQIIDSVNGGEPLSDAFRAGMNATFKAMGFTRAEIARMFNGDERLLTQFARKAASFASAGHKHPAERSRLLANRTVQNLYWYQDYPAARLNQAVKLVENAWNDLEAGRRSEAFAGGRKLAKFVAGTTLQGALTGGIMALVTAGLYGLGIRKKEAQDEMATFLADSQRAAMGGPYQSVINGFEDRGLYGAADNLRKVLTPTPINVATTLWQAATGRGPYRDMEKWDRIGKFIKSQTPGTKFLSEGLAAELLSSSDYPKLDAAMQAFYRWRRDNIGGSEHGEEFLNEDVKKEFRTAMKKVVEGLRRGDEKKVDDALWEARDAIAEMPPKEPKALKPGERPRRERPKSDAEIANERIRQSLSMKRILKAPTHGGGYRDLTLDEMDALRRHIGDEPVDRLMNFDTALKTADGMLATQRRR